MWDPPRPGLEPVSPALAGRLSTTAPPGKPWADILKHTLMISSLDQTSIFIPSSIFKNPPGYPIRYSEWFPRLLVFKHLSKRQPFYMHHPCSFGSGAVHGTHAFGTLTRQRLEAARVDSAPPSRGPDWPVGLHCMSNDDKASQLLDTRLCSGPMHCMLCFQTRCLYLWVLNFPNSFRKF